ncbi:MAG: NifB/NifX family molybdenum-iron cluster-binding protein [Methanobacterium sp.]|nr:NifB/NifX family molybdenum-iron cluster-binding protein [Methanobacterium sp.]
MKLAITSEDQDLNSDISPVFGRSPYLILVDLDENGIKKFQSIRNPTLIEFGTGNTLAQLIVNKEVEAVISGEMGPIVFLILRNAGIKIYKYAEMNAKKNIKLFIAGRLKEVKTLSSGFP